jgi:hypothetical protein
MRANHFRSSIHDIDPLHSATLHTSTHPTVNSTGPRSGSSHKGILVSACRSAWGRTYFSAVETMRAWRTRGDQGTRGWDMDDVALLGSLRLKCVCSWLFCDRSQTTCMWVLTDASIPRAAARNKAPRWRYYARAGVLCSLI